MLFSVVVPTYNRVRLLSGALKSVWRQQFKDYEIIVIDDGSTDDTQAHLQKFGNKIRYIRQANRGPGAARNVGAQEATGDYVAFLDSDDLWFPWTLDVFAWAIRKYRSPTIIAGQLVEFFDEADLADSREEPYEAISFTDYLASSHHPLSVGSGTCALRRDALTGQKFLEDRLNAEDHDLILRLGTLPGFVQIVAPTTLAWRRHSTSETSDFASTVSGALRLLSREKSGVYPGGLERRQERRRIISRHARPPALACVRKGELKRGWELYCSTLVWSIKFGQWKYVLGFPMVAVWAFLGRWAPNGTRTL